MALELIIVKKPYEVCFSGNPVVYSFQFTPYTVIEQAQEIKIQVRIEKETAFNAPFIEIYSKVFYPDYRGFAEVDIKTIVDAHLKFSTPKSNLNHAVLATQQYCRFRVVIVATKDGQLITTPVTSDPVTVLKGGLSYEKWNYINFFDLAVVAEKRPLHFFTDKEFIRPDEVKFLFWLYPYTLKDKQIFYVHIDYADGDDFDGEIPYETNAEKWGIQICPLGYKKIIELLVAEGFTPPAKDVKSFTIEIRTNEDDLQTVAPLTFYMDYRKYYDYTYLIYTNSLGGKDTIAILGEIESLAEYTTIGAQKIPPPSGFENALLVPHSFTAVNTETEKFNGNTNFLRKDALQRLRDLLLSRVVHEIKGFEIEKWDPEFISVIVNKKTVRFYSNRERLFGMAIEWQNAFVNNYYTPVGGVPANTVCPALENFIVKQLTKNTLQIIWSMPMPYDTLEVTVDNGVDPAETYLLYGNSGAQSITFINPAVYPATVEIQVKGRVACDLEIDPASYGPYSTEMIEIFAELLPIANDDLYYLAAGYTSTQLLAGANVLDNDYDPDGDAIEVISVDPGPTAQGGTYTLWPDGTVNYQAPSPLFNGEDSFPYTIQQSSNPALQANATVRIIVGKVDTGNGVYIKVVERNHFENGEPENSPWLRTEGDFYLTFWADPQATIPKNLTGGLDVNYKMTETKWQLNGTMIGSPTVTHYTQACTGTEFFIGHLITRIFWGGGGSYITREYQMEAGAGYMAI